MNLSTAYPFTALAILLLHTAKKPHPPHPWQIGAFIYNFLYKLNYTIFTLATPLTEQPSDRCYPQIFLILFIKGKSGDKGEVHASEVAFFQKAFSFASSGSFCPLIYNFRT
ncbi:hypothetical protein [Paenibacillus amylolyticus]|uniref:Secreted protein n=1 Tax=Paenibacillus amylolyticus TaxID=1451 RepID=A0ABD8AQ40_PAEAM